MCLVLWYKNKEEKENLRIGKLAFAFVPLWKQCSVFENVVVNSCCGVHFSGPHCHEIKFPEYQDEGKLIDDD